MLSLILFTDQGLTFTKLLADPDLLAQMYTSVNQAWIQNNLKTVSASTAEYIFKQITDTDKGWLFYFFCSFIHIVLIYDAPEQLHIQNK
jgi:hypothetical protein